MRKRSWWRRNQQQQQQQEQAPDEAAGERQQEGRNVRDLGLFEEIVCTQSVTHKTERMVALAEAKARACGATVEVHEGNVYAVKGAATVYPTIVAHTDTVHPIIPGYKVYYDPRGIYWGWNTATDKAAGIGGDDKCGVYVALSMLQDLPACKIALFRDEEIGCVGAKRADPDFFADSAFVLEADRRGNADFVRTIMGTELYGAEFAAAIAPYLATHGYKELRGGGLTDVLTLKRDHKLGVACANMSAGYFFPHGDDEEIDTRDLANVEDLIFALCSDLAAQRWEHVHVPPTYASGPKVYVYKPWKNEEKATGGGAQDGSFTYGSYKNGVWTWDDHWDAEWTATRGQELRDEGGADPLALPATTAVEAGEADGRAIGRDDIDWLDAFPECPTCGADADLLEYLEEEDDWFCFRCDAYAEPVDDPQDPDLPRQRRDPSLDDDDDIEWFLTCPKCRNGGPALAFDEYADDVFCFVCDEYLSALDEEIEDALTAETADEEALVCESA